MIISVCRRGSVCRLAAIICNLFPIRKQYRQQIQAVPLYRVVILSMGIPLNACFGDCNNSVRVYHLSQRVDGYKCIKAVSLMSKFKNTPFPELWFEVVAGWRRIFFRCSFRAPFFSQLGTPQNRYHKLFRLQSDPILRSKTGSKTSSHFGTGFFSDFSRFSHFLHTTSSASRIAPAISKPHFRLSSFLLFLLSLRPSF